MQLIVLGSNSRGNCYLLTNGSETLVIEAGVSFLEVKQALDFNIRSIVGCIVTHEHADHAAHVEDYLLSGIPVFTALGTINYLMGDFELRRKRVMKCTTLFVPITGGELFRIGNFKAKPFPVIHGAIEPFGFLITHPDCGKILFITDTHYCEYVFTGLNHIMIEANYSKSIIDYRVKTGQFTPEARAKLEKSHMSLDTCKNALASYDLTGVQNIVLIHLSNDNSQAGEFQSVIERHTGKPVTVATKGVIIQLNKP